MQGKDFVEEEEGKFVLQLHTFWSGLQTHGATLGFSPAEIDAAEKDYLWMNYVVNRNSQVHTHAKAYTIYKKSMRNGKDKPSPEVQLTAISPVPTPVNGNIEGRFRKRAARAKAHPNYNTGIGEALNIISPKQEFDKYNAMPKFSVSLEAGRPKIKFRKKHFHAMEIWKDSGEGHVKLERVQRSPYIDKSKLPPDGKSAAWKYKLIGVVDDEAVGQYSGEVTVLVYGEQKDGQMQ